MRHVIIALAILALLIPVTASAGERAMWKIALIWHCKWVQEFRCQSTSRECQWGRKSYSKNLILDFSKNTIQFGGAGPVGLRDKDHKSGTTLFREGQPPFSQSYFFYEGGMLWRALFPRSSGEEGDLQVYRCKPK